MLAGSSQLREIFSKLLLLQGLPPPPPDYDQRKIRKGPVYVHELNLSTKREVLELCQAWCKGNPITLVLLTPTLVPDTDCIGMVQTRQVVSSII